MGYTLSQAKTFIDYIAPIIVAEGTKRGYKVFSTTIAQAIIEGACGTSSLAKNYHNHFGMKCGSSWKGASVNLKTKEEINNKLISLKDNFRVFASDQEGIKGYYDFISAKRYENLKTEAKDYKQFAELLKADGYATSSTYIQTLIKTVEKYSLQNYDSVVEEVPLHIQKRRTLKRGLSGSDVIFMQRILDKEFYNIGKYGCDGVFGADTERALKQFQSEKGLVVDGICGAKTWMMLEKYN